MSPSEALALEKLADALDTVMTAQCAAFSDVVEALALIAARKADASRIGSNDEHAWTCASGQLFDLSQCGRLYRDPRN